MTTQETTTKAMTIEERITALMRRENSLASLAALDQVVDTVEIPEPKS